MASPSNPLRSATKPEDYLRNKRLEVDSNAKNLLANRAFADGEDDYGPEDDDLSRL